MFARIIILVSLWVTGAWGGDAPPATKPLVSKPLAAVFPLGGDAPQNVRAKIGFALREKLHRDGHYEPIDGPRMEDVAALLSRPADLASPVEELRQAATKVDATLLFWGQVNASSQGYILKTRWTQADAAADASEPMEQTIQQPTDLRFACEKVLEALPGVKEFEHPVVVSVFDDAEAKALWEKNPNLVVNGDFSQPGKWEAIYQSERYEPPVSQRPPATDKVVILRLTEPGGKSNNVLAMNLSKTCAENNGMACLSAAIPIQRDRRYRLSFRYRSDGPKLHIFVKGYTPAKDINGKPTEREIYRRQTPTSEKTNGQWVTITDDLNPQHVYFPVTTLRVDLYAYLNPGSVMFDDVVLKEVGQQTRKGRDDAIKAPIDK